ncbi:MAG: DegT/DnrJ/EryC1/StrS aminotransferase family protein, partial [Chloroflexi bacterium]|nr:DegT/DnrJ/EryC1/StrS aminotransferase family protein [Chloroflexota bacterium]
VEKKLTPRTKAVVTVHIGGLVSPHTLELADICKRKGIYLIEDAAHAQGSAYGDQKAGTFGIGGAFSFFSTKVMTTGEGGMVITSDESIYKKALVLRDQAKIVKGSYQNYHEELGYNWRMTEVTALMGITQLDLLDKFIERRNQIAKIYDEELANVKNLRILRRPSAARHNYYKYIGFLENYDREKLQKEVKEKFGVSMGGYVYEIPLHKQPAFKEFVDGSLPRAEDLCQRHVCPPIFYTMTDEEAHYAGNSIARCLA